MLKFPGTALLHLLMQFCNTPKLHLQSCRRTIPDKHQQQSRHGKASSSEWMSVKDLALKLNKRKWNPVLQRYLFLFIPSLPHRLFSEAPFHQFTAYCSTGNNILYAIHNVTLVQVLYLGGLRNSRSFLPQETAPVTLS